MIHIVLGTKAQLVKMAPRLEERGVPYNFVFTGQHRATKRETLSDGKRRISGRE